MAAYVISEIEIVDQVLFDQYRSLAQMTIEKYGGRYIVRGGAAECVEGNPPPKIIIIVEFATMNKAREWYCSPEYAEALKVRKKALNRRLIFIEGVKNDDTHIF